MYFLAIVNYIFNKFNYVILTRIPHHILGAKKWSRDYRFSLVTVIVGSIKYTYSVKKLGMHCPFWQDFLYKLTHVLSPKEFVKNHPIIEVSFMLIGRGVTKISHKIRFYWDKGRTVGTKYIYPE